MSSGGGDNDDWDSSGPEGASDVATQTEKKLKRPRLYKVLLHNDDYTTMEFVVFVLTTIYHHSEEKAVQIMLHVHQQGVGVAGVYAFEIAETKVTKTIDLAREHEYPLR